MIIIAISIKWTIFHYKDNFYKEKAKLKQYQNRKKIILLLFAFRKFTFHKILDKNSDDDDAGSGVGNLLKGGRAKS